jgi:hypothetical protein
MASWASKSVRVLLRVVLTVLLVVVALELGIKFAPALARFGTGRTTPATRNPQLATRNSLQPDWGGGGLGRDVRGEMREARGGVVVQRKADGDYALTMALPSQGEPGRSGVFEVPSTGHFKKELLPETGDAEAPAADIPLYPQSSCRTQVGRGTACFIGFYLTPDSLEAVRSFYVRVLNGLGWQRVTEDGSRESGVGSHGLETFAKSNEDRAVIVQLRRQDSVTTRIGLVATGSGLPVAGYAKERK